MTVRGDRRVVAVARSVARGASLGLLLAGLFLLVSGFSTRRLTCLDLAPHECAIAREAATMETRREMWMGGALVLLGVGILVGLQAYFGGHNTAPHGS